MIAEKLNADRVIRWLEKTQKSISNQASRGSSDLERNGRLASLCGRYDELKERAQVLGVWESWCAKHGWAIAHDGFDCAA